MKTQNHLNQNVTVNEIMQTVNSTEKTIDQSTVKVITKNFSSVDLWNIQRQHKNMYNKRNFL
ncbi:MAG: hypothetical protein ACOYKE_05185 [Ferruginibacter sp.]